MQVQVPHPKEWKRKRCGPEYPPRWLHEGGVSVKNPEYVESSDSDEGFSEAGNEADSDGMDTATDAETEDKTDPAADAHQCYQDIQEAIRTSEPMVFMHV